MFFTFQLLWQVEISCSAELDFIQPQAKARLVIHLSLTSLCLFCYAMAEYGIFRRYEPSLKNITVISDQAINQIRHNKVIDLKFYSRN